MYDCLLLFNSVGKGGVRGIAESLERAGRVRHVYVHAGGKIEALGTGTWAAPRGGGGSGEVAPQVTVETVCVVDVRQNNPRSHDAAGLPLDDTQGGASGLNPALNHNASSMGRGRGQQQQQQQQQQDRRHEDVGADNNWAEPRTGKKKKKKRAGGNNGNNGNSGNNTTNKKFGGGMSVAQKKKRERQRVKDQKNKKRNARTEGGWSGRASGMQQRGKGKQVREVGSMGGSLNSNGSTLPPLHQKQMAATAPPLGNSVDRGGLIDGHSTMPSDMSGHIQRANAAAEAILAPSGGGQTGGKRRTGKKSQGAFSKQLQNSPLMQPAGFGAAGKKKHT